LAFDFLDFVLQIPVFDDIEELKQYLLNTMDAYEKTENKLCSAIDNAPNAQRALKFLLTQMAPDFLTEASPLGRTVLGSFGCELSEMMKIFIDEYGYGVHRTKHSTLFEAALKSVGLSTSIHHYYSEYLTTSFLVINYFHYLTTNKCNWFKYLGALFYTEASIPRFDQQLSVLFKKYFEGADTRYFDEHVHIDKHHARMVLEKLIVPSIKQYGVKILRDIVFGFESIRYIFNKADEEFIEAIKHSKINI
jgi:hypothetical protein